MKNKTAKGLKIYGLIGYPIKHSLSPAMQNAAFRSCKLEGTYMLFEKTREEFPSALRQLKLMNAAGFNVTVPYKEQVIPYLDELDDQARRIGAVNTVLNRGGRFIGYNTDALGFISSLRQDLGFDPEGKEVLVIGAGGAARAIGFALAKDGARAITFCDIVKERSDRLAGDIQKSFPGCLAVSSDSPVNCPLSTLNLLVNASSCGMKKADPLPIAPDILPKSIAVYDIIYNPSPTKLVREAMRRGIKAVNGLGMLLGQGAAAFEIWTRKKAPIAAMRQALRKAIRGKPH